MAVYCFSFGIDLSGLGYLIDIWIRILALYFAYLQFYIGRYSVDALASHPFLFIV